MPESTAAGLRRFLEGLLSGEADAIAWEAVARLASRTLTHRGLEPEGADALVSDWSVKLLGHRKAVRDLLSLPDPRLVGAARKSLQNLLVDALPDRPRAKALAEHVRSVLEAGLPTEGPVVAPLRLTEGESDRIQRDRVAEAVRYFEAQESSSGRLLEIRVRRLVAKLMKHYFPPAASLEALREPQEDSWRAQAWEKEFFAISSDAQPDEQVRRRSGGEQLAKEILEAVGAENAAILARRAKGETFAEIGQSLGLAVASVHERLAGVAFILKDLASRTTGLTREAGIEALLRRLGLNGTGAEPDDEPEIRPPTSPVPPRSPHEVSSADATPPRSRRRRGSGAAASPPRSRKS